MAKIVLIAGKAAHGKTTTANIMKRLLEENGKKVLITPFAKYLKFLCQEYLGWDGKKDENGRHLLQYIGTDVVRSRNPNFWVSAVVEFIKVFSPDFDYFIIDDCRFQSELDCFSDFDYITIRVTRHNFDDHLTEEQRNHPSETALDGNAFHLYIDNDGDMCALEEQVKEKLEWVSWFSTGDKYETSLA